MLVSAVEGKVGRPVSLPVWAGAVVPEMVGRVPPLLVVGAVPVLEILAVVGFVADVDGEVPV